MCPIAIRGRWHEGETEDLWHIGARPETQPRLGLKNNLGTRNPGWPAGRGQPWAEGGNAVGVFISRCVPTILISSGVSPSSPHINVPPACGPIHDCRLVGILSPLAGLLASANFSPRLTPWASLFRNSVAHDLHDHCLNSDSRPLGACNAISLARPFAFTKTRAP